MSSPYAAASCALHIDDRAKGTAERASSPRVKTAVSIDKITEVFTRHDGPGNTLEIRSDFKKIVFSFKFARVSVPEKTIPVPLDLPRDQRDTVCRTFELRNFFRKHGCGPRHMKTADHHGKTLFPELPGKVESPWKLIRLDSDKTDHRPFSGLSDRPAQFHHRNFFDGFVKNMRYQLYVRAENHSCPRVVRERNQAGEGITGDYSAPPADYVAFIVIFGGFDKDHMETFDS